MTTMWRGAFLVMGTTLLAATVFGDKIARESSVPVVVMTDIGQYSDDAWALGYILSDPVFDVRAIVTSTNDTTGRAKIVAKLCDAAGQYPAIGIGRWERDYVGPQYAWARDYDLSKYPGVVTTDYVNLIANTIQEYANKNEKVTILEIGPPLSLAEALVTHPQLAHEAHIVVMSGSIFKGYGDIPFAVPEFNVRYSVQASQVMYGAEWADKILCAPLDTAGTMQIHGDDYQLIVEASKSDPLARAILDVYTAWFENCPLDPFNLYCLEGNADMPPHPQQASAILFDLVAACLAKGEPYTALVGLQPMHIVVTPEGLTLPSDSPTPTCTPTTTTTSQCTTHPGNAIVATSWLNQASFTHHAALCLSNHHLC